MTKHGCRRPKEWENSKDEERHYALCDPDVVIRICFVIRHSDFVITQKTNRETRFRFVSRPKNRLLILLVRLVLARLGAAHDELATEEFLVV